MVTNYKLRAIKKPDVGADRTRFSVPLITDQGEISIEIESNQLDGLLAMLGDLEFRASLINPDKGPLDGEGGTGRHLLFTKATFGMTLVNDQKFLSIRLYAGTLWHDYATHPEYAIQFAQNIKGAAQWVLQSEIPGKH